MAPTRSAVVFGSDRYMPSPIFGALLVAMGVVGWLLWSGNDLGGFGVFLFVVLGWVVSLALHEFAHAVVAYIGGDRSVADKGYLTLDVRHYTDLTTSLIFPIAILLIGGIGLPGGAVWINRGAIRSRNMQTLVSLAGPAASAVCALVCLAPIGLGWVDPRHHLLFASALGLLGLIQVIAVLFNLIPIPGLDGFGAIEPHLSPRALAAIRPLRQYGFIILIVGLWYIRPIGDMFWNATFWWSEFIAGDSIELLRAVGWSEFRFWVRN